jgi:chromosome segregation ATPase
MGTTALRKPQQSPERENLAAAIAVHQAASQRLSRVNAACEQHFVWPAQQAVEQAEQELAQARKREPQQLVTQLLGDQSAAEPTVEQCEKAVADARSALERALRMREALDGQIRAVQADVENAQRSVRIAVSRVVHAEGGANAVLTQYLEARREVARLHEILSFLSSRNCLPPYWDSVRQLPPTRAEAPWREALAALEVNADAPLPE